MLFKKNIIPPILILALVILPAAAHAHKIMIFGWTEGDRVQTISKFSGGKRVQNSPVSVYDPTGKLILTGKTSKDGLFSFNRPSVPTLKIVLEASMGHKASCEVVLDDSEPSHAAEADVSEKKAEYHSGALPVSEKLLEEIVEKSLDKKMKMVLQVLKENEEKQSFSEIIGGIGYILGLVGIALWFKRR